MSLPQTPSFSSHPYSHALQLKLYQAFIFSIPILFSIILFLLFYLFYLKRRAYALSTSPPPLPRSFNYGTSFVPMPCGIGLKGDLKDKLPKVLFDEDLKAKDSLCCVCLGEYEMREELVQVPSCKHVFHLDCIQLWLQSNSTCPLCRCSILVALGPTAAASFYSHPQPVGPLPNQPNMHQQAQLGADGSTTVLTAQGTTSAPESTSAAAATSGDYLSVSSSHETNHSISTGDSVVIHVQAQ